MNLDREVAKRVLEVVDCGLVSGVGRPEPGKMCVEAAVCYALGLPHGDDPRCVGSAVRAYKIRVNDGYWSSNQARATGLRRIAIAQLGSDQIDQLEFSKRVTLAIIREILPNALRAAGLAKEADACAAAKDLAEGRTAALAGRKAARGKYYAAYAYVAADAADAAAADAADAADAAAADAADAAAAAAAKSAGSAGAGTAASRDAVLTQAADIAERILVEMGSPGAAWLDLA